MLEAIPDSVNESRCASHDPAVLMPHCQEQTSARETIARWQQIYCRLGMPLQTVQAGCCGMSGLFGHETANRDLSNEIFNRNWKLALRKSDKVILATGFSCRCQLENHRITAIHPVRHLDDFLKEPIR